MGLAFLAKEKQAENALVELGSHESNAYVRRSVMNALASVDPKESRPVLRRLIGEPRAREVRLQCIELLCASGDQGAREYLSTLKAGDSNAYLQTTLSQWLPVLDQALAMDREDGREEWRGHVLAYWRACATARQSVSHMMTAQDAAKAVVSQDPAIPTTLLQMRLRSGDPVAPLVLGMQKRIESLDLLKPYVSQDGTFAFAVRSGLRLMGTPEAIRSLEAGFSPRNEARVNRHLAEQLTAAGDARAAELLSHLSESAEYDPQMRLELRDAAESIRRRLGEKPK